MNKYINQICNYLECQKREGSSGKNINDKWIVFLKSLNIEQTADEGAMVQIDRVLDVLDWAEEKGRISYSDWEDCSIIVASQKYRIKYEERIKKELDGGWSDKDEEMMKMTLSYLAANWENASKIANWLFDVRARLGESSHFLGKDNKH